METIAVEPPSAASVEELFRRGVQWFQNQQWTEALKSFDSVARLLPHRNDVHNYRARVYERLGRLEDALECLDRALAIDPRNVADLRNRGILLRKLGRPLDALASIEALLAIQPNDAAALTRRGLVLNELNRREEGLASIDQAARENPDDLEVLNARLLVLDNLGRYEEALNTAQRMLTLDSTNGDAVANTGMLMARTGRTEEALQWYDRALELRPDQPQVRYNRSLIRLSLGDWERGLEEFETRWETKPLQNARLAGVGPLWLGREDLQGKTLLLYHEQGYGDTLQCVRYVPLLAERGARVVLLAPPALQRLLRSVPGVSDVVSQGGDPCVHHYHCPIMSLPLAFRTTPETVPAPIPYLGAESSRIAHWQEVLGPKTRLRIGLVWGGRRYAPLNYPRDVPLELLAPLLTLNAELISLQKEMSEEDRQLLATLPIRPLGTTLESFADTAALIHNLDLVIAADTAVAHLAGAMGKPVWLMNRFAPCWRWLRGGSTTPWYPTMRQFRQPAIGDWESVVASVRAAAEMVLARAGTESAAATSVDALGPPDIAAPGIPAREKIRFVCATRLSKEEFMAKAALGRSLPFYRTFPKQQSIELRLFAQNRAGLSGLYNTAIEEARRDSAILVFIHDDVYLSDFHWADQLHRSLRSFDLVGLVGNRRRVPGQASWMFLDPHFKCDSYDNFSGVLGHGEPFPNLKQLSVYGEPGAEVKLLDGVLLAIRSQTLIERGLRFDPRFQFHFYDMDFCRQAELRQLRMGTCAMSLVHASAGELGSPGWFAAYREYLAKYGE